MQINYLHVVLFKYSNKKKYELFHTFDSNSWIYRIVYIQIIHMFFTIEKIFLNFITEVNILGVLKTSNNERSCKCNKLYTRVKKKAIFS